MLENLKKKVNKDKSSLDFINGEEGAAKGFKQDSMMTALSVEKRGGGDGSREQTETKRLLQ